MDKDQVERQHLAERRADALRPLIDFAMPERLARAHQIHMAHWCMTLEDSTPRAAERDFEAFLASCPTRSECVVRGRCALVMRRAWAVVQAGNAVAHMLDARTV